MNPGEWKYCPRCRGELLRRVPEGDDRPRLVCAECGTVVYENPAPCVCAIVESGGKILLTKRAVEPARGKWDLPGGYIEAGETPEQTLHRELAEETGIEVEITALLGFFVDTYGDGGTDTLNISYLATRKGGQERPGSDVAELAWFEPAEIPGPDALAFKNTREAIRAWRSPTTALWRRVP